MVREIATHQFVFFARKVTKTGPGPGRGEKKIRRRAPQKTKMVPDQNFEYREVKQWTLTKTGHFKVNHESRSVRCRIALWDCFSYAIAALIGCYKVAKETGSKFVSQKKSRGA